MLKKIITLLGFVGLAGCTTVTAPLPKAVSDWPFENKDKVTFVLSEDAVMDKGISEAKEGKSKGEELLIEIKKNSPANELSYLDNNLIHKAKIWFKKSPNEKDVYAFAFSLPLSEKDKLDSPEDIEMMNTAIYSRGKFVQQDGKMIFQTYVLKCPSDRVQKQTDCPYKTEAEAWDAALTLPIDGDGEKDTIPFLVK